MNKVGACTRHKQLFIWDLSQVAKIKFIIKIIFSSNRELNSSPTGTQQLPLGQHSLMVVGLIFRIINPIISNETDKTRTDPGAAVLFKAAMMAAKARNIWRTAGAPLPVERTGA